MELMDSWCDLFFNDSIIWLFPFPNGFFDSLLYGENGLIHFHVLELELNSDRFIVLVERTVIAFLFSNRAEFWRRTLVIWLALMDNGGW